MINLTVFRPNSIKKFIQKVEIGSIKFNKIFSQKGNNGMDRASPSR